MNNLIKFYNNFYPANNKEGYFLSDIIKWDDYKFEVKHDYMQWLFPDYSKLTKKDIKIFRTDVVIRSNVVDATMRMLLFYGFVTGGNTGVKQIKPLNRRYRGIIIGLYSKNNYIRIKHILNFLVLIEMEYVSALFFLALCQAISSDGMLLEKVLKNKALNKWVSTQKYLAEEAYILKIGVSTQKYLAEEAYILKIGGGYSDRYELAVDKNTVIIGNHTGIMKGVSWDEKSYWGKLEKIINYKFKIIVIDTGSASWLNIKQLPDISNFIKEHLKIGGVVIFEQQLYNNIIKYFPNYYKYAILVEKEKRKNLSFENFSLLLSIKPLYSKYTIKIDSQEELTYENKKFSSAVYRNELAENSLSITDFYKKILDDEFYMSFEKTCIYGLNFTSNSCYMDSSLLCVFAIPNETIKKYILQKDLDDLKSNKTLDIKCSSNINTDIAYRKKIQKALVGITESIRGLKNVKTCTNLRKLFSMCPGPQPFHKGGTQDAGEFLTYMFNIFQIENATERKELYGSNKKEWTFVSKQKVKRSPIITLTSYEIKNLKGVDITSVVNKEEITKFSKSNLWKASNDFIYNKKREITKIDAPLLVFKLERRDDPNNILEIPIIIPETLVLKKRTLNLSAMVVHDGGAHYTANIKCGGHWWFYDDNPGGYQHNMKHIGSYKKMLDNKYNDPLTLGTLFFYT
jgi:ubiquitin C-terminal hydrolase